MKKITILGLSLILTGAFFAQKSNVTSAVLEFKKFNPYSGDIEGSMKAIENAKKFIDEAAVHPDTQEDEKMLYYRGAIYYSMIEASAIAAQTSGKEMNEKDIESYYNVAKESFSKAYNAPKGKYKGDVTDFTDQKSGMAFNMGLKMYQDSSYEMASQLFLSAYKIKDMIGVVNADAKKNAIVCMKTVVDQYAQKKEYDKAIKYASSFQNELPNEIDPLTTLIDLNLQKGDNVAAESLLNKALKADPNNKMLHYVMGTIYMDLKENEKAEMFLEKAIEIDPNYTDAQYQLGAHLFNWANDLKYQAGQLDFNDPNEKTIKAKADEKMNKATKVLEAYIEKNPNDKNVLMILFETNYKTGNKEKALEYKKRAEAIK